MAAPDTATTTTGPSLAIPQATTLLTTFTHFLTVSIHNILYYRGLYPSATFLTSRAYNLPVHQSRHPAVCSWVRDAVDAARAQLVLGSVERLALVIYDAAGAVMERWMFDVARFPVWNGVPLSNQSEVDIQEKEGAAEDEEDIAAAADIDAELLGGGDQQQSDINWTNVDEQLRAAVRRLAYVGEKMGPLPEGCTFSVAVELRDEAEAPIGHPQPWVPTKPSLQPTSRDQRTPGEDVGGATTTAVRAIEAGPLFFECWVEESKAKLGLSSAVSSNG
ncbi:HORMA domain-containing protein [Xylaria arbuscula]|nr:HORMA domain-containing protein [Xylaria arbuscula]